MEIQGIPIALEERGEGNPVLIVHGWQGDRRYMQADLEPAITASPHRWRRLYVDLPGHGGTPAPDWLGTQAQMVSILIELVQRLADSEPIALVGSSYGGYLSLAAIRSVPHLLTGAALIVPDLPAPDGSRDTARREVVVTDPDAMADLAPEEVWIANTLVEQSAEAVELIRRYDMPAINVADQRLLASLNEHYLLPPALQWPGSAFAKPSLVVTARQDSTTGFRAAAALGLSDEFPRATFATLDLAGHWLGRVERPAAFRALITDWLDRLAISTDVGTRD
jgi:pimeloyl-ACP methyl ester carboxylesterase